MDHSLDRVEVVPNPRPPSVCIANVNRKDGKSSKRGGGVEYVACMQMNSGINSE